MDRASLFHFTCTLVSMTTSYHLTDDNRNCSLYLTRDCKDYFLHANKLILILFYLQGATSQCSPEYPKGQSQTRPTPPPGKSVFRHCPPFSQEQAEKLRRRFANFQRFHLHYTSFLTVLRFQT